MRRNRRGKGGTIYGGKRRSGRSRYERGRTNFRRSHQAAGARRKESRGAVVCTGKGSEKALRQGQYEPSIE